MNSKSKQPEIRNGAFIKARENLGLSAKDLAAQACLSTRQIEQIENGETSSFYGAQIKVTAAKKVAKILGLKEGDAFNYGDLVAEVKEDVDATPGAFLTSAPKKNPTSEAAQNLIAEVAKENQESRRDQAQQKNKKAIKAKSIPASSILGSSTIKQRPKKRAVIWLGLIATAVFSVISLNPLFFADKSEENIVVKEDLIEPPTADEKVVEPIQAAALQTPPAVMQVASDATANSEVCPTADAIVSSYRPSFPKKSADMVFVQVKTKQVICIVDASGKTQNKTVEPGVGASFYGNPPFKVLSSGLGQVDVFFQGAKVRPANLDGKTILLEAGDINQPSAPSDSQLR